MKDIKDINGRVFLNNILKPFFNVSFRVSKVLKELTKTDFTL